MCLSVILWNKGTTLTCREPLTCVRLRIAKTRHGKRSQRLITIWRYRCILGDLTPLHFAAFTGAYEIQTDRKNPKQSTSAVYLVGRYWFNRIFLFRCKFAERKLLYLDKTNRDFPCSDQILNSCLLIMILILCFRNRPFYSLYLQMYWIRSPFKLHITNMLFTSFSTKTGSVFQHSIKRHSAFHILKRCIYASSHVGQDNNILTG